MASDQNVERLLSVVEKLTEMVTCLAFRQAEHTQALARLEQAVFSPLPTPTSETKPKEDESSPEPTLPA